MPNKHLFSLLRKAAEKIPERSLNTKPMETDYKINLDEAEDLDVIPAISYPKNIITGGIYLGKTIPTPSIEGISIGDMVAYKGRPDIPYKRVKWFFEHKAWGIPCVQYEHEGWDKLDILTKYWNQDA